jgi:feruloyl-CoA synthase
VTADAFDDEGFFCSGDAVRFIDEARPQLGLCFDGRIAEDFKLTSGTWVNVGALRARALAVGAPYLQDVVITGHDRDDVGMLVFLWPAARELSDALAADAPMAAIAHDAAVRAWLQALMRRLADGARGSSQRIVRAMLQTDLPSAADGELTDKGSINQRAVLQRRAALVSALYAGGADPLVVKSETDH